MPIISIFFPIYLQVNTLLCPSKFGLQVTLRSATVLPQISTFLNHLILTFQERKMFPFVSQSLMLIRLRTFALSSLSSLLCLFSSFQSKEVSSPSPSRRKKYLNELFLYSPTPHPPHQHDSQRNNYQTAEVGEWLTAQEPNKNIIKQALPQTNQTFSEVFFSAS